MSQWGHDFRPSYLNIISRLKRYGIKPVRIALTATASPKVRQDLCEELELINAAPPEGNVLVVSSNRQELNLIVRVCKDLDDKADRILDDLRQFRRENRDNAGAALVFMPHAGVVRQWKDGTSPRRGRKSARVTGFAEYVEKELQTRVAIYNSKLDDDLAEEDEVEEQTTRPLGDLNGRSRKTEQNAFIQGGRDIMIATKGFGMGIDKPNIRLVVHRTPTANLEAYAQEAGRAGRDRELANVILYYSPDGSEEESDTNGKVRSDHDIQSFFIDNKYVRREDVLVMRAFLRTITLQVNKRLYFTSDQAMDYFESQRVNPTVDGLSKAYEWPDFPPYEAPDKFWGSHLEILRRGHEYANRRDYVRRILSVMYRIRPNLPVLGSRVAIIESAQEVPIRVQRLKRLQADKILQSNDYFGHLFREKGITAEFLSASLQREQLLTSLAGALGISIYETSEILKDVQYCAGDFEIVNGREVWIGDLLDIWLTTPRWVNFTEPYMPERWRQYAGAYKRAVPQKPKGSPLTENDWFPDGVLNQSIGWEVELGAAFHADDQFDAYLNAFMQIHDERQRSDWDSYHRLLTEYVGVNSDGTLKNDPSSRTCLRAAMLGYLKSYEVVVGGNCYSCSVCVPNENFDNYLDQRPNAVVRIGEAIQSLLDHFEEYLDQDPQIDSIERIFDVIQEEEMLGRSLRAYVQSWSARLLQDTPGHRGALWLRIEGALRKTFDIDSAEMLRLVEQICQNIVDHDSLQRADILIGRLIDETQLERVALWMLRAEAARKRDDLEAAYAYWHQAIQEQPDEQTELAIRQELIQILADGEERTAHIEQVGWLTDNWDQAASWFSSVAPHLGWTELTARIQASASRNYWQDNQAVFIWTWLKSQQASTPETTEAIANIDQHLPNMWLRVPGQELLDHVRQIKPLSYIINPEQAQNLAKTLQRHPKKEVSQIGYVLLFTAAHYGIAIAEDDIKTVGEYFGKTENMETFLDLLPTPPNPRLASTLLDYFEPTSTTGLNNWLRYFDVETLLAGKLGSIFLARAAQVIEQTHIDISAQPTLLASLTQLRTSLASSSQDLFQVEQLWHRIVKSSQSEYVTFVGDILRQPELVESFGPMWGEISETDLERVFEQIEIAEVADDHSLLSYLAKQFYKRTEENIRSIAGELILCGLKRGMRVSDTGLEVLCNLTLNRNNTEAFIDDPMIDSVETAVRLLPYFRPVDLSGLLVWLRHFPADVFATRLEMAIWFLDTAADVITRTQSSLSEYSDLKRALYQLRAYALSQNVDQARLEQTWRNIIAFSPLEQRELVLLAYENGADITEEFSQYVFSAKTEQELASLLSIFASRSSHNSPLCQNG